MASAATDNPNSADILVSAFQSTLTDPDFDIPSQQARKARTTASCALSWCESHQDDAGAFLVELKRELDTCFVSTTLKLSTQRERMWERFFKLRSSSHFQDLWKRFLTQCGTDTCRALYQHITDIIFNGMVSNHFPIQAETEGSKQVELDYHEKNALRYVGGYVTRRLHQKITKSKHELKKELCTCLTEMSDVDPDEMSDESDDWMKCVDRGGLKKITNMVYMLFVSIELVFRQQLQGSDEISFNAVMEKAVEDEDVDFYWSIISADWEPETAAILLKMIIEMWLKIRGHSTARAWLELYKQTQKKSVQKSKGIRKQLVTSTSASTSTTE